MCNSKRITFSKFHVCSSSCSHFKEPKTIFLKIAERPDTAPNVRNPAKTSRPFDRVDSRHSLIPAFVDKRSQESKSWRSSNLHLSHPSWCNLVTTACGHSQYSLTVWNIRVLREKDNQGGSELVEARYGSERDFWMVEVHCCAHSAWSKLKQLFCH